MPDHKSARYVRKGKRTPCPTLLWVAIIKANEKEPWYAWAIKQFQVITRSPTHFTFQNPDLKKALRELGLEGLNSIQIGRIRECPAPKRLQPRPKTDREFQWTWGGRLSRRNVPLRSETCGRIFWAWRHDQKTCDDHLWCAGLLRVEKHQKNAKNKTQKQERQARQLKDARKQRKIKLRAKRKANKLAKINAARSQPKPPGMRADFRLLQNVKNGLIEKPADARDPHHLEAMIDAGYVTKACKLSREGRLYLGVLRKQLDAGTI